MQPSLASLLVLEQMDGSGWNCWGVSVTMQTRNLAPTTFAVTNPAEPGAVNYTVTFGCATLSTWYTLAPYAPSGSLESPQPGVEPLVYAQRTVAASTTLSGKFQLSYNGSLTTPLSFAASAADVKNALTAIAGAGAAFDVYGSWTSVYDGGTWFVTQWSPYGPSPPMSVVIATPIPGTNLTTKTLLGPDATGAVVVLQGGSTDALLWPIPMDFFRVASPGARSHRGGLLGRT